MKKTYKYRLYPNKEQSSRLSRVIETCRHVYNDALTQKRLLYKHHKKTISYEEQYSEVKEATRDDAYLQEVYSQGLQDVLRRLDRAFNAFFERAHRGRKPGYPRYKGRDRYSSFTYPQNTGFEIRPGRPGKAKLRLGKLGSVNMRYHREVPEEAVVKTCTIVRKNGKWHACFSVVLPDVEKRDTYRNPVGIDVGLENLLTLDDGTTFEHKRCLRASEKNLAHHQRMLSKKKRGSSRRKKQKERASKLHEKVANQRKDYLHKVTRRLADTYDLFLVEDLRIKNMLKNHNLAKTIADASWGTFSSMLTYKAEEAGGSVVKVNPRGTSQACSECGAKVPKKLSERMHSCPYCGYAAHRDVNAARNILRLGTSLTARGGTPVGAACEAGSHVL
ncbi:MAG: transposase [Actinobacteria bacterium]|nr:transposase [Actinomycetota bacterium]MCG2795012.1 transposase [Actinomycetes bacterium]MBU4240901.1 transposase [Actinomycetota bacterium]MBU4302486.1 transposase [Actinomycetota bacterium]MBU4385575.1 transposase [Actinomycetota bacterium]